MVFKLAHLSDLHLGYKTGRILNKQGINLREADGYIVFSKIVKELIDEEVDAVVVAGDIFHTPAPDPRTIIFTQNQLRRLANAEIPVYMLSGNHDVSDVKADIAASKILHDPWRNIHSHVEPYYRHEIADGINLHLVSHHMYSEQAETMKNVKSIKDSVNIFSTHGSCIDPILEMKLHTEHSPREIVIPDNLLLENDWDYCLLGHIHERGWVGSKDKKTDTSKTRIYYNGSTIRRGFSDKNVPLGRGYTIWNISETGEITHDIRTIAQRPQYDFTPIDSQNLTSGEITEKIIENLLQTQVTEEFSNESAPILRQVLLNVSPAKYATLDWKNISKNTTHAMSWQIKTLTTEEVNNTENPNDIDLDNILNNNSNDPIKIYDNWVNTSNTFINLDENFKETVKKQARDFIELGQEVVLNND